MNNQKQLLVTLLTLLATSLLWCCAVSPPAEGRNSDPGPHFYFVQITDTHFGDGDHFARVERIVEAINELPMEIKCVVHTGDVTSDNILQDSIVTHGLAVLNQLSAPIHYVAGNHDILEKDLQTTRTQFETNFGPLVSVREYEGIQFVTIFTEPIARGYTLDGYDPLLELEKILSNRKPSIVFHHSPSPDDFYKNAMHDSWDKEGLAKWEQLLNTYDVKAVMAGHYHRDEHHWLGEIPLYVSAPVGSWWGRQASFRLFEYKNGKLGYRTQYIQMKPWRNG